MSKDIMPVNGQFAMPTLPYEGLGNIISKETLGFHHGKHLKAYVDNLNKLLPGSGMENLPLNHNNKVDRKKLQELYF